MRSKCEGWPRGTPGCKHISYVEEGPDNGLQVARPHCAKFNMDISDAHSGPCRGRVHYEAKSPPQGGTHG